MFAAFFAETVDFSRASPELTAHVGWLSLAVVVLALVWVAARMEWVRRSILALEDPRMFAVMRIGTALMTIQCFWNLKPYWRFLWSDEGLFAAEDARSRFGSSALTGWTPVDGFLDHWAVLKYLWGKHSLFYFFSSPDGVEAVMYAFFAVLLLYAAGVFSRVTGVVAWLMLSGVYNHNALYLEGTDTVYRCLWFALIFARTGDAWSVDNWWRCRRLRARGRLQEVGAPAEPGKQPVYRLIPGWPRYLMIAQLVAIYTNTGSAKTGSVWRGGDALYYALNMDHFYRFEEWTQQVSAAFGTNVFRVMTWVTHWWECCFGLAALGMILRFAHEQRDQPWFRALEATRWRVWLGRAALLAAYLLVYRLVVLTYGYVIELPKNAPEQHPALVAEGVRHVHIAFAGVVPAVALAWWTLRRWPLRVRGRTFDHETLRRWLLGRRVWLGLGVLFHGFLIGFMNIGMFPFIMLMMYVAWLRGEELAAALRWFVGRVRRTRLARLVPAGADAWTGPAQRAEDVPARGRALPDLVVVALGALLLAIVGKRISGDRAVGWLVYGWVGLTLAVALAFRVLRPRAGHVSRDMPVGTGSAAPGGPPAYAAGAPYRALALGFVVWHVGAFTLHLFPSAGVFAWRGPARTLYGSYMSVTGTAQSWKMFAPNPPRANTFLKTVVVDRDGRRWDIGYNSYSYRPFPWIYNDRMRKMHRRMIGKGKWYLRPWSHFHCREWLLEYGTPAASVETYKIATKIPTPEQVASKGWYRPSDLKATVELLETHTCPKQGDLPAFMKARRGLPLTEADENELADSADREAKLAEQRRKTWAVRRDWGGSGPKLQAAPAQAPAAEAARPADDDGGADGE